MSLDQIHEADQYILEHHYQFGQGLGPSYRKIIHAYQTERLSTRFTHGDIPVPQSDIENMVEQVRAVLWVSNIGMISANIVAED